MKEKIGLFLGAGASYEAGMPLVWELTAELKAWLTPNKLRELNAGWREVGTGHPDVVIDDLASILERSDLHYEAILGYLETQYRRQGPFSQSYHGLYSWLVEIVYHILYLRHVNNRVFVDRQLSHYDGLKSLASNNAQLWIFSLNHDVMIETIAARHSIHLYSGFSSETIVFPLRDGNGKKKGEIQAQILAQDDLEKRWMHYPNPPQAGIYLMKIHGALDIFTFDDGKYLLKLVPQDIGWHGYIDALRAASEDLYYPDQSSPVGRVKAVNEIAFADDRGEMQFLRRSLLAGAYKFDPKRDQVLPKSMLKHFQSNLNFVNNLICIGYSFGDSHINDVLRDWLAFSAERRIEIVDPFAKGVPSMLAHLSPQVTITRSSTGVFLDDKAGIVRSSREQLESRLASLWRGLDRDKIVAGMNAVIGAFGDRLNSKIVEIFKVHQVKIQASESEDNGQLAVDRQSLNEVAPSDQELLERIVAHFEEAKKN